MKIISTGYSSTPEYTNPKEWLERISFYTGILEELAKQHEVISIERINYEGDYQQNGVQYHFINQKRKVDRFPLPMHHFIKNLKPDIVLVNGFIFPLQIIQLRMILGRAVKIIVLHRAEKPFKGLKKYLQKIAGKCVNAYLFSSVDLGKEWIEKGIIKNKQKIHEVMQASSSFFPMDKTIARSILSVHGSLVFLWVGRLEANKDPLTVLKAFIQFLNHHSTSVLYMIYQSEELIKEVKQLAKESKNIKLIGKVVHKELQYWYNSADFVISGSHYEGSGIAVCEAMSCGCIPVVTNIDSFRTMTGRGKCGLLYEPGNVNDLLAVLLKAKQLDIEKEKRNVLQQFREELSFEAIKKKIEVVIGDL
jgi:glycosyltransferase involved in cell wall biosynthesis